ncbi:MAG: hypothetical protein CM15mP77_2830 [Synechococcus sp.]|nr:MAG: hypothetical protein CM15mP77_2830 [Synechococcus sp.]
MRKAVVGGRNHPRLRKFASAWRSRGLTLLQLAFNGAWVHHRQQLPVADLIPSSTSSCSSRPC